MRYKVSPITQLLSARRQRSENSKIPFTPEYGAVRRRVAPQHTAPQRKALMHPLWTNFNCGDGKLKSSNLTHLQIGKSRIKWVSLKKSNHFTVYVDNWNALSRTACHKSTNVDLIIYCRNYTGEMRKCVAYTFCSVYWDLVAPPATGHRGLHFPQFATIFFHLTLELYKVWQRFCVIISPNIVRVIFGGDKLFSLRPGFAPSSIAPSPGDATAGFRVSRRKPLSICLYRFRRRCRKMTNGRHARRARAK